MFNFSSKSAAGNSRLDFTRPSAGVWHHYVMVMDRSPGGGNVDQFRVYVDGRFTSGTVATNASTENFGNHTLYFMHRNASGVQTLFGNGQLDDVRIYNYVLTPEQIRMVYNGGSSVRFGPVTGTP